MEFFIPEEFWAVLIERYKRMAPNIRAVIGKLGALDREEIIEHLEKKDEIGSLIAQIEFNYLKTFKADARL